MLRHSLLMIYRGFLRAKNYFIINLVGLTAGITCTMLILLWVLDELRMDKFHKNDARLFQVMRHLQLSTGIATSFNVQAILADALKAEIPEIDEVVTTTSPQPLMIKNGNNSVRARGFYADVAFFQIFSFPLKLGDPRQILKTKSSIAISDGLAKKLFGDEKDIIGRMLQLQNKDLCTISGVFKDIPAHSSTQFEFVLPFEKYKEYNAQQLTWNNNGPLAFVLLSKDADLAIVNKKIEHFLDKKTGDSSIILFLQQFSQRYLHNRFSNGVLEGGRINFVNTFTSVAVLILLIACMNFINLSTARATRKAKELAVKKTVGAQRGILIKQLLTESIIISMIALVISLVVVALLLPAFNLITDKKMVLDISDSGVLLISLATVLITGLLAGSYPAFYLSGFQPAIVLKGELKRTVSELLIRRVLVVFQFALSVFLIMAMLVVYNQIEFFRHKNLGYDKEKLVRFYAEGSVGANIDGFLEELKKINGVERASAIGHNLSGRNNNTDGINWPGKNPEERVMFEMIRGHYELDKTLGIKFVEGRYFEHDFGSDTSSIIFNESAIEVMGLIDPIGKTVQLYERPYQIIGIVKDFNFQSLREPVNPLFFILSPEGPRNVILRLQPGDPKETINAVGQLYRKFNPGFEFEPKFQDEEYERQYLSEQRASAICVYFAIMAILISCLGLFGLTTFSIERRLKEIGIRKTLGSSSTNVVMLLSREVTQLVVVGIITGLAIAYFILESWLSVYEYHINLSYSYFLIAGVVTLVVAWITVGWQAFKASNVNPVICLRDQ